MGLLLQSMWIAGRPHPYYNGDSAAEDTGTSPPAGLSFVVGLGIEFRRPSPPQAAAREEDADGDEQQATGYAPDNARDCLRLVRQAHSRARATVVVAAVPLASQGELGLHVEWVRRYAADAADRAVACRRDGEGVLHSRIQGEDEQRAVENLPGRVHVLPRLWPSGPAVTWVRARGRPRRRGVKRGGAQRGARVGACDPVRAPERRPEHAHEGRVGRHGVHELGRSGLQSHTVVDEANGGIFFGQLPACRRVGEGAAIGRDVMVGRVLLPDLQRRAAVSGIGRLRLTPASAPARIQ